MFCGIVETVGKVENITNSGSNIDFWISSTFTSELKIDQSVAHNGVCLTVVDIDKDRYKVTAIEETLTKTNLGSLILQEQINLERCVQMNGRIDGHMVQGHVDQIGTCINIVEANGSWNFTFTYDSSLGNITVEKGSITVNGTSLTVVNSSEGIFSVSIIPYTFNHTTFKNLKIGSFVNLEFDVFGKYIKAYLTKLKLV